MEKTAKPIFQTDVGWLLAPFVKSKPRYKLQPMGLRMKLSHTALTMGGF